MFNQKKIAKLEEEVTNLKSLLLVKNYFYGCPCCNSEEYILKSEAVSFEKLNSYWSYVETFYTDKNSYKNHSEGIKEFNKMIEEYKKQVYKNKCNY